MGGVKDWEPSPPTAEQLAARKRLVEPDEPDARLAIDGEEPSEGDFIELLQRARERGGKWRIERLSDGELLAWSAKAWKPKLYRMRGGRSVEVPKDEESEEP